MKYAFHRLRTTSGGEPIYAFVDEWGHTVVQAIGNKSAKILNKYLNYEKLD